MVQAILSEDPSLTELFAAAGGYDLFLTPPGIVVDHPARAAWVQLDTRSIQSNGNELNDIVSTIWRLLHLTTLNATDRAEEVING